MIDGEETHPAVMFIHGFGCSSALWKQQVDYFLPDYRVITIDLPGHGQSSWVDGVNLDLMAEDLKEFCEVQKLHSLAVVGSSFGGMVAIRWMDYDPYRIHRLVCAGALPRFTADNNYSAGLNIDKIRTLSGQFDGDYEAVLDMFFRSLFSRSDRLGDQFKVVREIWSSSIKPQREALKTFLDLLETQDIRERLINIQCPVQIISGSEDYICPPEVLPWLSDAFHNVRIDTMEKTGHLPFLSRPDEFNHLVEKFI